MLTSDKARHDTSEAQLIGIYEISKVLGTNFDLDKALHDALNILSSYLDMRHGAVILGPAAGELSFAAVAGQSLRQARDGASTYPLSIARKVLESCLPLVLPVSQDHPELIAYTADCLGILKDGDASFLAVPIRSTDGPLGVLSVLRIRNELEHQQFQRDLRFLSMIATLFAQTVALTRKVQADREQLLIDNARLSKQVVKIKPPTPPRGLEDVIGTSEAMHRIFSQVQQAAPSRATVLLRGESGTGKERIAHAIHALSTRAQKPFIKVNCAALSESVLESELFGHEKGAFTGASADRKGRFELAHGGTLFLDEIGEISSSFQSKLLRALQEGEFERVGGSRTIKVDVRLVAATNRDLEQAVTKGEFRADLYYRLNVVPIFLPPLRERSGDIPLLANHFLDSFNKENNRHVGITQKALTILQRCKFPGNVRELENCIWRTATMTHGDIIDDVDLSCRRDLCLSSTLWGGVLQAAPVQIIPPAAVRPHDTPASPPPVPQPEEPFFADDLPLLPPQTSDSGGALTQREILIQAMERCGWVQAKAARLLGLTPRQIGYALRKHNVEIRQL